MAGEVRVGGEPARKPGQLVGDDDEITVAPGPEYVSRGGIKLANALDALEIEVGGRSALDVGASTGASPTSCCSVGPPTWSRSTSPTGNSTGAYDRMRA